MIYFFTPYSFNRNLFEAYNGYASLVQNEEDYICFLDGDVLFFQSNFGHLIQQAIDDNKDFGMLTCFTNRVGGPGKFDQVYSDKCYEVDSMKFHNNISLELEKLKKGSYTKVGNKIGGLFIVIQKKTWNLIRNEVQRRCNRLNLLGVDYAISESIAALGLPIYRIDSLYIFHYYRLDVNGSATQRGLS